ncbi:Peptidase C13 family protein [Luteibacter sp. UNCMF331Sha3.1]|uniref:C13 family peptidase n=1 Tax=Luteibacter sp. UNCMF331Sha3.1 TaxID=1502760 RepID=UPI0008C8E272|nr:C13 family peptidase [Luteibacter sp. UNCMF331Sha3.1]SEN14539.1 Peptidase C13 family protein [Luteibacter sp. UNCMF331Sha3.1]
MRSFLDPRRRAAIGILGAFVTGVLLTLALLRFGPEPLTARQEPVARTAVEAPAAVATAAPAEVAPDPDADPWPADAPTPEQVFTAQPDAVRRAVSRLSPRVPGKPNVYAVAFAGDGSEDVFRNEAEYLDTLMAQRFGSAGHTLVLENNPATLGTRPLASWTNLEEGLAGLARVMDPREDILLLYVATHGGDDHSLLVDMDPIPLDQLDPDGLADILQKHAFSWKVLVVNACYSGGFVPKLRGPGTLVLTSAREDRTSFGCGADADITYFGRAWLAQGLNATPDFVEAFGQARSAIAGWEKRESLEPSEPQIDIGAGIEDKLAGWRKGALIGPAVPFKAAR